MTESKLIIIAAVSDNNVIGNKGKLPWHIPKDLKRFNELTMGHPIIMGRKTYESFPGELPGRNVLILSGKNEHNEDLKHMVYGHPIRALSDACYMSDTVFVGGGTRVYDFFMPLATHMELTHVHKTVEGDAFFPAYDLSKWRETSHEGHEGFDFVTYERRK